MATTHRSRMDGSHCADPVACVRWHGTIESGLAVGDACECCGALVTPPATWKPVLAHGDRGGPIVYWRLVEADTRRSLGAVSRQENGTWRALRYGTAGDARRGGSREIGMHTTWQRARRAVEADVAGVER